MGALLWPNERPEPLATKLATVFAANRKRPRFYTTGAFFVPIFRTFRCRGPDLHCGPYDFQCHAVPTELPRPAPQRGFPPASATGRSPIGAVDAWADLNTRA